MRADKTRKYIKNYPFEVEDELKRLEDLADIGEKFLELSNDLTFVMKPRGERGLKELWLKHKLKDPEVRKELLNPEDKDKVSVAYSQEFANRF